MLESAENTIFARKKFNLSFKPVIFQSFYALFANCCKCCNYKNDEYRYFKALAQLASEMDVKRILKSLRFMRAFVRFRTTKTERQLLRMQATDNVVILKSGEDLKRLDKLHTSTLN